MLQSTGSRHTGLVVPRHVGSSWTRARTHVPCIGRRILNHCTTREVPMSLLFKITEASVTEDQEGGTRPLAPTPPHPPSTKGCTTFEPFCCLILGGQFPRQSCQVESRKFVRKCRSSYYCFTFLQRLQVHSQRNVPALQPGLSGPGNVVSSNTEAFPQHSLGWVLVLGVWSPSKTTHSCEEKLGTLMLLVVSYWNTHTHLPVLKKRNVFPKCHIICNDSPTCEKVRDSFLLLFLLFLLILLFPKPAPIGPQCSKSWPIIIIF